MPHVFRNRKDFAYWFSNPMDNIIEGNVKRNDDLINRLHGIIRPFVLRRLKKDVETQLPGKYEHIVKCQLSRRQVRSFFISITIYMIIGSFANNSICLPSVDVFV